MTEQPDPPSDHRTRPVQPLPPEALGGRPSSASIVYKVASATFTGILLVLVFAILVPQIANYQDVWQAFKAMPLWEVLALVAGGALCMFLSAATMAAPLEPRLGLGKAFIAQQSSNSVSNTIPGPSGTAARFLILRSYGVDIENFTRGTFSVSVWNNLNIIAMPGLAVLLATIFASDDLSSTRGTWLAVAAVSVTVIAVSLVVWLLRSEGFARWLGSVAQRVLNTWRRWRKHPLEEHFADRAAVLRASTVDVLKRRGKWLTGVVEAGYWTNGILLVSCLYAFGITRDQMPIWLGLVAYTVGRVGTIVQITPGGIGTIEAIYIAVYVAVLGESAHSNVVGGVFAYRALTFLMPIAVGGVTYLLWRRQARRGETQPMRGPRVEEAA